MEKDLAKALIKYFKSLGVEVYTNTKARGHQGFFLKNRIDVSKNVKQERLIPTLLHEFAHYVHNKIEPDMPKTGGNLEVLFKIEKDEADLFLKELLLVTNFVDENSLSKKLIDHKNQVKAQIKKQEGIIKEFYPNFMRSKKFIQFEKFIKKSKAKYLLKYDRVKFVTPFLRRVEIFSIDKMESDFPEMNEAFCAYIRLKSLTRKQARISRRINYFKKYYSKPAELFARLTEGIYLDEEVVQSIAPTVSQRFFELLNSGCYFELKDGLSIVKENFYSACV